MENLKSPMNLPSTKFGSIDQSYLDFDSHLWASNERMNIFEILKSGGELNTEKWLKLKGKIIDSLKEATKGQKLNIWHELHMNLLALVPLCGLISQDKEILSIMRSLAQHLNDNLEWSYSLPGLIDTLSLFLPTTKRPTAVTTYQKLESVNERPVVRKKAKKAPSSKIMPDDSNNWFVDPITGDLFDPTTLDTHISIKVKKMKMKDIIASIGTVGKEIVLLESAFEKPFEQLICAMNVDMSGFGFSDISGIDAKLRSIDDFYEIDNDMPETKETAEKPEKRGVDLLSLPTTGREGVVYMIKCYHLKEMRVAYFNLKAQRIVDYYSLVAVRQFQVEQEHFIFSSVGIIHKQADGTGLAMSLTDWYKESILYYALQCIPFVKTFMLRKHFQSWISLTVHNRHRRKAKHLENKLLLANIVFGKSLLQVLRLLDEVGKITLVPTIFEHTHTVVTFLKEFSQASKFADGYLQKFYKYVKIVVDETAAECYKHFHFCQDQTQNIYLYSDDCIYKKKLKQKERHEALRRSTLQVYQLGDFVRLVNYLLNSTIVAMTLHNIVILSDVIASLEGDVSKTKSHSDKEAIFETNMIIKISDSDNVITFSPNVEEIEAIFRGTISGIPQLILKHCYPLDGLLSTEYLNRYKDLVSGALNKDAQVPSVLTSKAESRAQMMEDSALMKPNLPFINLPTKSEDDLRVATPPQVNPNILDKSFLIVVGQAMPSKFTPMSSSNVFDILSTNSLYQDLLKSFKELFLETESQMKQLIKENEWLLDVRAEYSEWSKIGMESDWDGQSPYIFEQRMVKVKGFLLQLNCVESSVTIPNKIFVVSLAQLLLDLTAEMEFELDSIFNYVLGRARCLGGDFIKDITGVLEILRLRTVEAESFTKVAMHIVECRERSTQYQTSVDYIKSLFDVLKVTDKPLGQLDRDIEDQVTSLWESFLFQLQEATEFINGDKANVIISIKSRLQELENSAKSIVESLNDELYSVLSDDRLLVLADIKNKLSIVESIKVETDRLIACYQSLQPEAFVWSVNLDEIIVMVTFLQSQWSLLHETKSQIDLWKLTLFSQFDVPAASDLILGWQRAIIDMRSVAEHKPIIVKEIEEVVTEFATFMALFSKLSSPLFLLEHWQRFFRDIGQDFIDPFETLTVGDLIDIDIRQYTSTIDTLHSNAVLRNKASAEFEHHLRFWMTREFDFSSHVPEPWFKHKPGDGIMKSTTMAPRAKSDAERYYDNKSLSEKKERLSRLPLVNNRDIIVSLISDFQRLHEDITDSMIALQSRSKSSADQYGTLYQALEELRRLSDVLEHCQEKWMFLERIFGEEYFVRTNPELALRFQPVNFEILSILSMLQYSPTAIQHTVSGHVFLAMKVGNIGHTQLLHRVVDLLAVMDEITSSLVTVLNNARDIFPRMYFLSDYMVAMALSCDVSHNIDHVIPFARLCFPSVAEIALHSNATGTTLSVCSVAGETVRLIKEVPGNHMVPQWLKEFEVVLKSSVKYYTGSCLTQQLTEGGYQSSSDEISPFFVTERPKFTVFDEIDQIESLANKMSKEKQYIAGELVHDILSHYQSWLLKYPIQTLLLAENLIFTKSIRESISNKSISLVDLRNKLLQKQSNVVRLSTEIKMDVRSKVALEYLLLENRGHIDILNKLIDEQVVSLESFSYQSLIKYSIDLGGSGSRRSSSIEVHGDVQIEVLCSRYLYEYEYLDVWRTSQVSERSIVAMLTSLTNYAVGTVIGGVGPCKETLTEVARILGRHSFSLLCDDTTSHETLQQLMMGGLLSGSLVHLDHFERLQARVISALSRDIWLIRDELTRHSHDHIVKRKNRALSASTSLVKTLDKSITNISERTFPVSSRDSIPRPSSVPSVNNYHDGDNPRLTKERTWLHLPEDDIAWRYSPRILSQIHLYNGLLDIRYGYGVMASFSDKCNYQEIPLTMKSQMRTHVLIPMDRRLQWKRYLILAGCDRYEELETCLDLFMTRAREFLPAIIESLRILLPSVISTFQWPNGDCRSSLGKYLYDMIILRLSPEVDSLSVLRDLIIDSFYGLEEDIDSTKSSALIHQIKSQLRIRGMKVTDTIVGSIVDLQKRIESNKTIIVAGEACSGKTTSLDVLSAAVNGLYSSAQRALSGSKRRGTLDILKTISQERRIHSDMDECCDGGQKRIYLVPVSLSNFTTKEMSQTSSDRANNALTSIVKPLLKAAAGERFQIWLHVDQSIHSQSEFIYSIQCLFEAEACVKIVIERESPPMADFQSNPELFGLVRLERIQDLWRIILKRHMKQLLCQKIITYYGCKFLTETGESMLQNVFDSVDIQLKCSQDPGVQINCVLQAVCVLEIMLRQYAKYSPHDKEDNLTDIDRKYSGILCFSVIQAVRGAIYSILVGQRLLKFEEFEDKIVNIVSGSCEIVLCKDDVNVGIFGVMLDFNSLILRPYEDLKGCRLPELWSNADGVAQYLVHLMVKYKKSVCMYGDQHRVEVVLDTVKFNKRLHLTGAVSVADVRKCINDNEDNYWKIVSNEDPLTTRVRQYDVVVLERFSGGAASSRTADAIVPFILEHGYFYDGMHYDKVSTEDVMLILVDYSNRTRSHYSKITRNTIEVNVLGPSFQEARRIAHKSFARWLQKVERHKDSFSKVISQHIADFIVDVGVSIRQYRINQITGSPQSLTNHDRISQVTWRHICKVIKSVTAVPIDVLQETIKNLEKTFPIEKSDFVKRFKKYGIYIRLIRHTIFELCRVFVDCASSNNPDEVTSINEIIHDSIQKHLSQNVISENIDDLILKHFPVPVERMSDIVLWPCRLIDQESYHNHGDSNYQPIAESHSWSMLNKAQEKICSIAIISDHLIKNSHLVTLLRSQECLTTIIKIYKHLSSKNCRPSALFLVNPSSIVSGCDYGLCVAGLLSADYVRPEGVLSEERDILKDTIQQCGRADRKIVLHIDSTVLRLTQSGLTIVTDLLTQDSLVPFLQYLRLPDLHRCVRDLHPDMFITTDSQKEIRLSKSFLENVQRNMKILITCSAATIHYDDHYRCLGTYFRESNLNYITLSEYSHDLIEESINHILEYSSPSTAATLARMHDFLADYFQTFEGVFGNSFPVTGAHLPLAVSLYHYLCSISVKAIKSEMEHYSAAVASVVYSERELDMMKTLKTSLQEDLKKLNDEVEVSGADGKSTRDLYATALVQCKSQENKVVALFGPLNEMKEKSKSNFDDVSPTYLAALDAIRNLDPDAVEEIKSYVKPPQQVRDLIGLIFDLLGYETTWELIKERMVKINLYEELLYLDKDHISDENFKKLEQGLVDPRMHTENLEGVSHAAASLSKWLIAVYRYSSLNKEINPQLGQLLSCQDQINRAQTELGKMRVRADQMRQELEKKIANHKQLLGRRKSVADNLKNLNYKINSGSNLLSDMSSHIDRWRQKEEALRMEIDALSDDVMHTVIRCVYLSRLPYSLRIVAMDKLRGQGLEFKGEHNRLVEEQDYRDILNKNAWSSIHRNHLLSAIEVASVINCPGIVYPDLGSIIMVHICKDACADITGEMLLAVLQSEVMGERFRGSGALLDLHYRDCGKTSVTEIDHILSMCVLEGSSLVLDKVHLLTELTPGVMDLLVGTIKLSVHSMFRLLLISNDESSMEDHSCRQSLGSQTVLHFNFTNGRSDFEMFLETLIVQICEPELSQNVLNCQIQRLELEKSNLEEKTVLTHIAAGCLQEAPQRLSVRSDKLSTVSERSSLLEVDGLHSLLLQVDSKLIAFDESRDSIKEKEKVLLARIDKYRPLIGSVSLMLYHFNMFPLDVCISHDDDKTPRNHDVASRVSLKNVVETIKLVGSSAIKSITMTMGIDPEITEMFLEILQRSILIKLIECFYITMESEATFRCVLEYCIDTLIEDAEYTNDWSQSETKFIRKTILCKDTDDILMDIDQDSMDVTSLSANDDVDKEITVLSLILETNIVELGGITKSLINDYQLWMEYFKFPFLSCNMMPGFDIDHQPGLLLKALVWRVLNPDQMEQIQSSIVAHVFGEEIFKTKFQRRHALEGLVISGSATQPIIVSTTERITCGIESPLEAINRVRINGRYSVNIRIIDCSNQSEMDKLTINESNVIGSGICSLVAEPNWIIFSNFHLCSPEYFNSKYFRFLLRHNAVTTSSNVHRDSRIFITLELNSFVKFPESFLAIGQSYHCSVEWDIDRRVEELLGTSDETCKRSNEIVALFHCGLFAISPLARGSVVTVTDYTDVVKILAQGDGEASSIVPVLDSIYGHKIPDEHLRSLYLETLTRLSQSVQEYMDHQMSRVLLRRRFNEGLWADIHHTIDPKRLGISKSLRETRGSYCLVDQRTVEVVKSSVMSILHQIMWTTELATVNTQHHILRIELINILRKIFPLPIWRMRSISSIRFDEALNDNDIDSLCDQQCLSNDILPTSWAIVTASGTISQWLMDLHYVVDRCKDIIDTSDHGNIDDLLIRIRELRIMSP